MQVKILWINEGKGLDSCCSLHLFSLRVLHIIPQMLKTLKKNLSRVLSAPHFTNEETEIQRLESAMRSWAKRPTDQEGICLRHNYLAGLNSGIEILANGSKTKKQNSSLLNSHPLLLPPLQEASLGQWANIPPQVLATLGQWGRVARGRSRCFWGQPSSAHCTPHCFLCKHSLISLRFWAGSRSKMMS